MNILHYHPRAPSHLAPMGEPSLEPPDSGDEQPDAVCHRCHTEIFSDEAARCDWCEELYCRGCWDGTTVCPFCREPYPCARPGCPNMIEPVYEDPAGYCRECAVTGGKS